MMNFGYSGYLEATKRILDTARYVEQGYICILTYFACIKFLIKFDFNFSIRKIDGIFVFGKPATSVIAMGSKVFDIFRLSDALCQLGWNLNTLQFPSG